MLCLYFYRRQDGFKSKLLQADTLDVKNFFKYSRDTLMWLKVEVVGENYGWIWSSHLGYWFKAPKLTDYEKQNFDWLFNTPMKKH